MAKSFQPLVDTVTCVRLANIAGRETIHSVAANIFRKTFSLTYNLPSIISPDKQNSQPSDREGRDTVWYTEGVLNHTPLLHHVRFPSFACERRKLVRHGLDLRKIGDFIRI